MAHYATCWGRFTPRKTATSTHSNEDRDGPKTQKFFGEANGGVWWGTALSHHQSTKSPTQRRKISEYTPYK